MRPDTAEQAAAALRAVAASHGGAIARGAGRSYGDAAQNGGGVVIDTTALRGRVELDGARGLVRAGAGATLVELLRYLHARGLTLPVLPGTRHVTVGGAIASDVHGKNHPRDGSFARHVESFVLYTPAQGALAVSRAGDPELFHATVGGMGLTGVVLEATLRTAPLSSRWALTDIDRTDTLAQALELMGDGGAHRYSIAWLDLLAHGAAFGRAVLTRSDDAPGEAVHGAHRNAVLAERARLSVPAGFPGGVLRPAAVRAFNALRWRRAPRRARGRLIGMATNLFPLDALGAWNRLYGPGGLVQYQFAVPAGEEQALGRSVEYLRRRRLPMYLAVVKRLGPGAGGPLSFPLAGWTLAVDLPAAAPGLYAALERLDELVVEAGGRVYLTKDSRLSAETVAAMYPELDRFMAVRARVDPEGVLRSDMARRLGLCPTDARAEGS
jgi:decaprenylphospho-beta-D-ribofuranose 2-oxidase